MRSPTIAAALILAVSAFPSPKYQDLSIPNALEARAPQFIPFKGLWERDNEDEGLAWIAIVPKPSPEGVPIPLASPPSRRAVIASPNRLPPKSAPWSPPKAQQPKPIPPPPKEPPFPDAEEDDEKIKAINRMQREPNAWELDQ